jgi:hypothetical protein
MPPKVNIIVPAMSDQERFQKWEEMNKIICEIWDSLVDDQKICIIHHYSTDKEGQKCGNKSTLSIQEST